MNFLNFPVYWFLLAKAFECTVRVPVPSPQGLVLLVKFTLEVLPIVISLITLLPWKMLIGLSAPPVNALGNTAEVKFVKAKAQCKLLKKLEELKYFSEEEKYVIKQGRNAQNHHIPKNVDIYEYMYATAFEALIGYLYLMKKDDRLKEIFKKCLEEN